MRDFILILVFLLIILGTYLGIKRFQTIMKSSDQIRKVTNEIPSSATQ
ncbi:MAG: hypothetical protein WCT22_01045 [Patescibacteria group bacterium]